MQLSNFNNEMNFNDKNPAIKMILDSDSSKEIRILMKKGQIMKEHKTAFPIVVHLISGNIDFEVENTKHNLEAGAILSLDSNVPHSLSAKKESVVRLSLSKQDTLKRVEKVVE